MTTIKSITTRLQATSLVAAVDPEQMQVQKQFASKLKSLFSKASETPIQVDVFEGDGYYKGVVVIAVTGFRSHPDTPDLFRALAALQRHHSFQIDLGIHKGKPALLFT